jgi:hypothetical protein
VREADFAVPSRANFLETRFWIEDESAEALCGARGPSFRPGARLSQRLGGRVVQVDEKYYGSGAILLRLPVILS